MVMMVSLRQKLEGKWRINLSYTRSLAHSRVPTPSGIERGDCQIRSKSNTIESECVNWHTYMLYILMIIKMRITLTINPRDRLYRRTSPLPPTLYMRFQKERTC